MTPTLSGAACSTIDRLLDDALAGRPGAAERLDAHTASCAACIAEARLADTPDDDLLDALACLDAVPCPPAVLDAALAEARRGAHAPDRGAARPAARRSASRRSAWVAAAALVVAVLTVAVVRMQPDAADAPRVADAVPVAPLVQTPGAETPDPPADETTPIAPPPSASATQEETGASETEAPGIEPPIAAPEPAPVAAPRSPLPAFSPTEAPVDLAAAATPADTAAARADLQVALAILSRAHRAAEAAVSSEMRRVGAALAPTRVLTPDPS